MDSVIILKVAGERKMPCDRAHMEVGGDGREGEKGDGRGRSVSGDWSSRREGEADGGGMGEEEREDRWGERGGQGEKGERERQTEERGGGGNRKREMERERWIERERLREREMDGSGAKLTFSGKVENMHRGCLVTAAEGRILSGPKGRPVQMPDR